jgi:hypothetical protein
MEISPEREQQTFLVEHYGPGITAEAFLEAAHRMRQVTEEMSSSSLEIRVLHSTLVPEDETSFCVLRAASLTIVEEAYRRAGLPFERIVDALEPEPSAPERAGS